MSRVPRQDNVAPRLSTGQRLIHLLFVVLGWVGFVWLWWKVTTRPWDSADLMILIVGSLIALPAVTLIWVVHNLALHRRKGPRSHVPIRRFVYDKDWNGREVDANWLELSGARIVVIDVDDKGKRYRAGVRP